MRPVANLAVTRGDIDHLIHSDLVARAVSIDLEAEYPESFLRDLGRLDGLGGVIAREYGGTGRGISDAISTMARIAEVCLSTAFIYWCHTACARYVQLSANLQAKHELLPHLASGAVLGGTALSNTFKAHCGIERYLLTAKRIAGGYEIHGNLPWVSNLGPDHVFVTGCPVEGDGRLVFFVVRCNQDGFKLRSSARFAALDGTGTFACQFRGARVDDAWVLAHPEDSANYLRDIQPGMILAQMGMSLGLIKDCIELIESSTRTHAHINRFEVEQADNLRAEYLAAEAETQRVAALLDARPTAAALTGLLTDVLRVRLEGGELCLRAANAAMLHQGARGFLREARAQRRLREAYFVAIVTPALKHLRHELGRTHPRQGDT